MTGFLNGITLCLTTRCNLTCNYCGQKDYYRKVCRQDDMSFKTALMATVLVKRRGNIRFFGGEPMLSFNFLIKGIVKNNRDKYFAIISNGTAPFENYDWLHRNSNCFFRISYDGRNDDRGQGSDGSAIITIKKLIEVGAKLRVRITLTPVSLKIFPDTVGELVNIGVREIWFEVKDGFNLQDKVLVSTFFSKINEAKMLCSGLILKTSALFPGPCEVRKGEDAYVLPDGQIYLCHKDFSKKTLVGNVSVNSSVDIMKNLVAKRKVRPSQTLCLVQEKMVGWKFFSQVLRKILKGGDDKMHMKKALILMGKIAQISDALEALGSRLKKIEEELLIIIEKEEIEKEESGPNR